MYLGDTLYGRNVRMSRFRPQVPNVDASSPSSAKLLIISVNEQTRPARATIPRRNALFIIYQKQSTEPSSSLSTPLLRLLSSFDSFPAAGEDLGPINFGTGVLSWLLSGIKALEEDFKDCMQILRKLSKDSLKIL